MKIRLDKLTVESVEVEIPDACPSCNQPTSGAEVRVSAYDSVTYDAYLDADAGGDDLIDVEIDDSGSGDAFDVQAFTDAIYCLCGQTLATTAEQRP